MGSISTKSNTKDKGCNQQIKQIKATTCIGKDAFVYLIYIFPFERMDLRTLVTDENEEERDNKRRALDILSHRLIEFWFGRSAEMNNRNGQAPLARAASEGDETSVFLILHHFKTIYETDQAKRRINQKGGGRGWSPLHEGVEYLGICQLLLEAGANPNLRDDNGYTALHFAIEQASDEVACLLIDPYGAQIECTDYWTERTPLTLAAIYGNEVIARRLLQSGAMVDRASPHVHRTSLHIAAAAGHADLVALFLAYGANVDAKDRHHGSTPLHLCVGRDDITPDEQWDYNCAARHLIKAGADLNSATDVHGDTPLHVANRAGNDSLVELLLQEGADPDLVNDHGVAYQ